MVETRPNKVRQLRRRQPTGTPNQSNYKAAAPCLHNNPLLQLAAKTNKWTPPAACCHGGGAPSVLQNSCKSSKKRTTARLPMASATGTPGFVGAAKSKTRRTPNRRTCSIAPSAQAHTKRQTLVFTPGCGCMSQTFAACYCVQRQAGTGAGTVASARGPAAAAVAAAAVAEIADAAEDASTSAS